MRPYILDDTRNVVEAGRALEAGRVHDYWLCFPKCARAGPARGSEAAGCSLCWLFDGDDLG